MASTGINRGGLAAIYIAGVKVTHSTNATLSISQDVRDVTTKDTSRWKTNLEGLASWEMSGDFFFAENATEGFTHSFADVNTGAAVTVMWSSGISGDKTYSGSAYITSMSRTAGTDGDSETFSISFTGAGTLTEGTV